MTKHNSINTYQFNDVRVTGNNTSTIQTLLPDGSFLVNNSDDSFDSRKRRNRLRSTYEWNIDSTSSLKVIATGSVINSNTNNISNGSSFDNLGNQINQTFRQTIFNAQEQNLLTTLFWRKRFKKAGRTISLSSDINGTRRSGDGFLFAENTFFTTGTVQEIDQKKTNEESIFGISTKLSYTEPLSKKTTLEFNYQFGNNTK